MTVRLTEAQKRVVGHLEGALLVVAGPGSGKTRVLTERIKCLLSIPEQHFRVLALTFTNKAANEMVERLSDVENIRERAFVGTMHSFCMEVLANRGKSVGIDGLPHIFESWEDRRQVLGDAVRQSPSLQAALRQAGDARSQQKRLGDWLQKIGEWKNSLIFPEMLEDPDERALYEQYDAELRASAAVDYDDLLLLTYRLFSERPKTAEFYCRQYSYVCIDEAQDLNEAQYRLLRALCGSTFRNVVAVGDPKQAIYVWNGADPKYLDLFVKDFGSKRVELKENFRSSKAVVEAARRLDPSYNVEGQLPVAGLVKVSSAPDEKAEAALLLGVLKELFKNGHADIEGEITPERCAVLARSKYLFREVEASLQLAGINYYKKFSATGLQMESEIVTQFELALRLLANPKDRLHFAKLAAMWKVSQKSDEGSQVPTEIGGLEVVRALSAASSGALAKIVMNAVDATEWTLEDFKLGRGLDVIDGYAASLSDDSRASILLDTADWRKHWDYYVRSESGGNHSVQSFLGQVALGTTQMPSQPGVALLTVHAAKGLEFDVVFVIGMNEGSFPDYRATGTALDEESRNAFVAVTRSKRLLYLTYPEAKLMPWGDLKRQQPSRYIRQMMSSD